MHSMHFARCTKKEFVTPKNDIQGTKVLLVYLDLRGEYHFERPKFFLLYFLEVEHLKNIVRKYFEKLTQLPRFW